MRKLPILFNLVSDAVARNEAQFRTVLEEDVSYKGVARKRSGLGIVSNE